MLLCVNTQASMRTILLRDFTRVIYKTKKLIKKETRYTLKRPLADCVGWTVVE